MCHCQLLRLHKPRVIKICQCQPRPRHHGQNNFSNNKTTMTWKFSGEIRQWEIQIIYNSEIHNCWVKDCIKKSRDTRHIKWDIVFSLFLHTDRRSLRCLYVFECASARLLMLCDEWCGSLDGHRLGQVSWTVHLYLNRRGCLIHDKQEPYKWLPK